MAILPNVKKCSKLKATTLFQTWARQLIQTEKIPFRNYQGLIRGRPMKGLFQKAGWILLFNCIQPSTFQQLTPGANTHAQKATSFRQ
jgi:hypothetical protein